MIKNKMISKVSIVKWNFIIMGSVVAIILLAASYFVVRHSFITPKLPSEFLYVLIGSYTQQYYGLSNGSPGIFLFKMDKNSGEMKLVTVSDTCLNPSFVAVHPNKKWIYAVNELQKGSVSSFVLDTVSKSMHLMNQMSSEGIAPCHLSVDKTGKFLMVANYGSGNVVVLPIAEDGTLLQASSNLQHYGKGVNKDRQEHHMHT